MAPTMHHCLSSRAHPPPSLFCELALKFAEWNKAGEEGGGRKSGGGQQASDCDRRGAQSSLARSARRLRAMRSYACLWDLPWGGLVAVGARETCS